MTTAIEKPARTEIQKSRETVMNLLDAKREELSKALPKHIKPEFFIRTALTAINKNPKLLACTKESLLACALDAAALGLVPDGRRCHLIPYKDKCSLLIDYKGKVELAMNSGTVSNIHADKVCFNDVFVYDRGEVVKHDIDFRKERGNAYAYYCIITFKDGTKKSEVMTKEEVDAIRKRSMAANSGPWVTDYDEMGKKTVFHRASKWIQLSPEIREKIEGDYDLEIQPEAPRRPKIQDVTPPENFLEGGLSELAGKPVEVVADGSPDPADIATRLVAICNDFDLDVGKAEAFLASKGFIKKGQTIGDLSLEKLEEIEANPASWVNSVNGAK